MFTGIITDIGTIVDVERRGDLRVRITTRYDTDTIDIGASIACSGACLTVVHKEPDSFSCRYLGGKRFAHTAGQVAKGATPQSRACAQGRR